MTKSFTTATAVAAALAALGSAAWAGPAPVQLAQMNAAPKIQPKIQPAPPPNLARPPAIAPKIDMSRLAGEEDEDETEKETNANPEQIPQETATGATPEAPAAARQSPTLSGRVARSPLPAARDNGWIRGLSDEDGIRGMVEAYFRENALLENVLDSHGARSIEEFAKDFGIDPSVIQEFADTLRGQGIEIYRVGLSPLLDIPMGDEQGGSGIPGMNPLDPTGGADPWDPTGFGLGGRPGGQGLVSTKDRTAGFHRVVVRAGNTSVQTSIYPDKSSWVRTSIVNPDGSVRFRDTTTDVNGTEVIVDRTWSKNPDGQAVYDDNEVRAPSRLPDSQAEEERQATTRADGRNAEQARETAAEQEEARAAADEGDSKIDQYQPADGEGSGDFCPLILEFCRRALAEAQEERSNILVGEVLVNPGDPDVQPKGSRLVYDPEDLVINPAAPQSEGRGRAQVLFRARIPVWVNPPGPNEPQLEAAER